MSAYSQLAMIVGGALFYGACIGGVLLWGLRKSYKEKKGGDGG